MNESDARLKLIDPVLTAKWAHKRMRTEYYFTDGEIVARGRMVTRKKPQKPDYLLSYAPDLPIAIVEAKDTDHSVGAGLQQAMSYAPVEELVAAGFNFDLCGYPHEEEIILPPDELIRNYRVERARLDAEIDAKLAQICAILGIEEE